MQKHFLPHTVMVPLTQLLVSSVVEQGIHNLVHGQYRVVEDLMEFSMAQIAMDRSHIFSRQRVRTLTMIISGGVGEVVIKNLSYGSIYPLSMREQW